MREYLGAPAGPDRQTPHAWQAERDNDRRALIDKQLKPLVESYLAGRLPLATFKSQVDGINKRNPCWGFRGIKGQMFFNMLVNTASDAAECDQELKAALAAPNNEDIPVRCKSRLAPRARNARIGPVLKAGRFWRMA